MYFGIKDKNKSLFLERLFDGPENELTIFVCNSASGESPSEEVLNAEPNEKLRAILSDCTEIVRDYSQLYKIYFDDYIMYQTRNESYASYDPNEIRIGKGLILFEKSRLLDSVSRLSNVFDDDNDAYPAKFRHYGIYTQNHVVDIISHIEPSIQKVKPEDIPFAV